MKKGIFTHNCRRERAWRAFTLIELLIVVAIIAILAAIAVPNFLEAQVRAKVSRVKADMRSLGTAMESYTVDNTKPAPTFNGSFTEAWPPYGTRTEARVDRFHWLTSPVAYISSAMFDAFQTGATNNDPNANLIIIWSPKLWTSGMLVSGTANCAPTLFKEQSWKSMTQDANGFWVAFSFGPDRTAEVIKYGGSLPSFGLRDYDPTNGTISGGDIFRARGGGS